MNTMIALIMAVAIGGTGPVQLGTGFTYQGELKQLGAPANGAFDFQFELYDVDSDGVMIANAVLLEDVPVVEGVFTVELDFGSMPYAGDQLWLAIAVREGTSEGAHTILAPRQKVTAVPYALHAEFVATGSIGDQEINPAEVQKRISESCAAGSFIVSVEENGTLVCGTAITDESDPIFGASAAASITANDVTEWDAAYGVFDIADPPNPGSIGLAEIDQWNAVAAGAITGVTAGTGLSGGGGPGAVSLSADLATVQARVAGTCSAGQAIRAVGDDGSVTCQSVENLSTLTVTQPDDAIAQIAAHGTSQGSGLFYAGQSLSYGGGFFYSGDGNPPMAGDRDDEIIFFRRNVGVDNAVFSFPFSSNIVRFFGNVEVQGLLSKAGGTFKIDHPLDPKNKNLYHSFVESPDMMNVYNGNVVLDKSGEAWVELPEYFEALNTDFRYQLTAIGAPAPVYVAEEIAANRFRVAGGEPGMKVSWQVTGVRADAWANANRIEVEVDKQGAEKGRLLHPEVWPEGVR